MKKLILILFVFSFFSSFVIYAEVFDSREEALEDGLKSLHPTEANVYPIDVSYRSQGSVIEDTINVFVKFKSTSVYEEFAIDAFDVNILLKDFKSFSKDEWISMAKARAFYIDDGSSIVLDVDSSNIVKKKGTYELTFLALGEKKVVKVNVGDTAFEYVSVVKPSLFEQYFSLFLRFLMFVFVLIPFLLILFSFSRVSKLIVSCYEVIRKDII